MNVDDESTNDVGIDTIHYRLLLGGSMLVGLCAVAWGLGATSTALLVTIVLFSAVLTLW